jgi:AraC family transcriptional regulator, transcriptional activator of pobA
VPRKRATRRIPAYLLYGEPSRRIAGRMLHVETIQARSIKHHWKIDPHLHQALYQMIVVLRGRGVVQVEGARAQYSPPAIVVMPAGAVHGFEFEPGTTGHVISFSEELHRELVQRDPHIGALFAKPLTLEFHGNALRASDLAQGIRMLAREYYRSDAGHDLALQGWLEVVLANVLRVARKLPQASDAATGRRRQLVARFGDLIERQFRSNRPVAEFATQLNVSESRLRTACLAQTNQSPVQLVHARLLLEAKRQLHYTDNSVREIAFSLGFDDPAYFTRFFSRRAGASPRAFRKRGPERALADLG